MIDYESRDPAFKASLVWNRLDARLARPGEEQARLHLRESPERYALSLEIAENCTNYVINTYRSVGISPSTPETAETLQAALTDITFLFTETAPAVAIGANAFADGPSHEDLMELILSLSEALNNDGVGFSLELLAQDMKELSQALPKCHADFEQKGQLSGIPRSQQLLPTYELLQALLADGEVS